MRLPRVHRHRAAGRLLRSLVVLGLLAGPALAARTADATADAQVFSEKGYAAYGVGRYDDAIAAFERAYELDPAPILLFNVAQAHWKKGALERALAFYRRYLASDPRDDTRPRAETRVREIEAKLARERASAVAVTPPPAAATPAAARTAVLAAPAPPPPEVSAVPARDVPPEPRTPIYRRPWLWGVVGAAVLGTVAIVAASAGGRAQAFTCEPDCNLGVHPIPGK